MDRGLPVEIDNVDAVTCGDMANAIRVLAVDAVGASTSGNPDMSLAMADVATVLWRRFLKVDPAKPNWADRDRFVLSAGENEMLLNALLHLTGDEAMTIDRLKIGGLHGSNNGVQPADGHGAGIETITPRFGQDLTNAVGLAFGERVMASQHGADLVDHDTFMFASLGCLTEGNHHQAASLAAHLKLGRLMVFFDENETPFDGATKPIRSGDILKRFEGYGWDVSRIEGHDHDAITKAIDKARKSPKPSLIACKTTIGSTTSDKPAITAAGHADSENLPTMRQVLGWPQSPFVIPDEIRQAWQSIAERGRSAREAWELAFMEKDVATRAKFGRAQAGGLSDSWRMALENHCRKLVEEQPAAAGRTASRRALGVLTQSAPNIIKVSDEFAEVSEAEAEAADGPGDQDSHSGEHEDIMAAVMNGIAQHGGLLPYGRIAHDFSGGARNAIRQSALTGLRVVYVLTPEHVGAGEDGPLQQSHDQLASLRAIPNLDVMHPADAVETAECWALALRRREGPSVLALSHQTMPTLRRTQSDENLSARGAYVLAKASSSTRAMTLLASGSDVHTALDARERLEAMGIPTAVVSVPCIERFDRQSHDYRTGVLGTAPRLAIEAENPFGWTRYVDSQDDVIGSTAEAIVERVFDKIADRRRLEAA